MFQIDACAVLEGLGDRVLEMIGVHAICGQPSESQVPQDGAATVLMVRVADGHLFVEIPLESVQTVRPDLIDNFKKCFLGMILPAGK